MSPAGENLVEKAEAQTSSQGNTVYVNNTANLPAVNGTGVGELPTSYNLSDSSYNYTFINSTETPGGNLTLLENNALESFSSGDVVEFLNVGGSWNWTGQIDQIGNTSSYNYSWCNFTNPVTTYNMSSGFANLVPMPGASNSTPTDPFYTIEGAVNGAGSDEVIEVVGTTRHILRILR